MATNKLKNSLKIVIFFQYIAQYNKVFDKFNIHYNTYGSGLFVFYKTLSIAKQLHYFSSIKYLRDLHNRMFVLYIFYLNFDNEKSL